MMKRQYTIPLRRAWQRTERYRRSKTAVRALREFLAKHMKSDDVKLGEHLNEKVWSQGSKRPPAKVSVNVEKNEDGRVYAELIGHPLPSEMKTEEPEEKPAKKAPAKKVEKPKAEEKPAEQKAEAKADAPAEKPAPQADEKKE